MPAEQDELESEKLPELELPSDEEEDVDEELVEELQNGREFELLDNESEEPDGDGMHDMLLDELELDELELDEPEDEDDD